MRISFAILLLVTLLPAPLSNVYGAAPADPVAAAVSAPDRSPADRERDTRDHPVDVLQFFGVTPGMTVVDLFAGGGYYSELIGRIVGAGGKVYMHNNAAFQGFAGDALKERIASGRLVNVTVLSAEVGALGIPDASVHMVLMVRCYHDLYFKADDWSVEPAALFADINAMLKPGGVLAIVDHAATAGSGSTAAQQLHRIDETFARADIESRGFSLTGSIDVLRNPGDDHTKSVFVPAIQGHTDGFVYRFVKTTPTPP